VEAAAAAAPAPPTEDQTGYGAEDPLSRLGLSPSERSEAERILRELEAARYHRGLAAERLGMSRTTLWRKMKQYRL
jgi:transcriptional regulator of acetoin/glycerol metabolism